MSERTSGAPEPAKRHGNSGFLSRLGLSRPELRAWAMYDWAVSAVQTTIMVAVFPIYFVDIAKSDLPESRATQAIATANTIVAIVLAVLSPVLGAMSDYVAAKKRMLGASMLVGAAAVAGMFFVQRGDYQLALVLFVISLIGATASTVFYDALLPHIASEDEIDRVSSAGYAVGYVGGGVLLALNLAWILRPEWFGLPSGPGLSDAASTLPTRLALLSVAVWWVVFSVPLFLRVPEPPRTREPDETSGGNVFLASFVRLGETFRALRAYKQAFLMLLAFMVYNDGIQTIQKMAAAYGKEIGIGTRYSFQRCSSCSSSGSRSRSCSEASRTASARNARSSLASSCTPVSAFSGSTCGPRGISCSSRQWSQRCREERRRSAGRSSRASSPRTSPESSLASTACSKSLRAFSGHCSSGSLSPRLAAAGTPSFRSFSFL